MGRKLTNEEFLKRLDDINSMAIPLEPYTNCRTKMNFMCKRNHEHTWRTKAKIVLDGCDCPYCSDIEAGNRLTKIIKENITVIADSAPELIKYLTHKEDAYKFSKATRQIISWTCPLCGCVFDEKVSNVYRNVYHRNHFVCPSCSTGKSYPNKLMGEVLKELHINYIQEYQPDWSEQRRYDFYFLLNNCEYIIEMDGGFHKGCKMQNRTLEDVKYIDDLKDRLAKEHGIKVIRVDCDYKFNDRFIYICDNIIKNLSDILDLSNVDFEKCDRIANTEILVLFSEAWEKFHDVELVSNELHYTHDNTIYYLKLTEKYNISSYCFEEDRKKRWDKHKNITLPQKLGHSVRCIETGEEFESMSQARKKYKCDIGRYFRNKNTKYAGMLADGTKLHWEKLNK